MPSQVLVRTRFTRLFVSGLIGISLTLGLGTVGAHTARAEPIAQLVATLGNDAHVAEAVALLRELDQRHPVNKHNDIDAFRYDPQQGDQLTNIGLDFNKQGTIALVKLLEISKAAGANPQNNLADQLAYVTKALAKRKGPESLSNKRAWYDEVNFPHLDALSRFFRDANIPKEIKTRLDALNLILNNALDNDPKPAENLGLNAQAVIQAGAALDQPPADGGPSVAQQLRTLKAKKPETKDGLLRRMIRIARSLEKPGATSDTLTNKRTGYDKLIGNPERIRLGLHYQQGEDFLKNLKLRNRFPAQLTDSERERLFDISRETPGYIETQEEQRQRGGKKKPSGKDLQPLAVQLAVGVMADAPAVLSVNEFIGNYFLVLAELKKKCAAEDIGHGQAVPYFQNHLDELRSNLTDAVAAADARKALTLLQANSEQAVRAAANQLSFDKEHDLAYHTAKHYEEMPAADRQHQDGNVADHTQEYLDHARNVIQQGTLTRTALTQDGHSTRYVFNIKFQGQNDKGVAAERVKTAIVRVTPTQGGFNAEILTYMPDSPSKN